MPFPGLSMWLRIKCGPGYFLQIVEIWLMLLFPLWVNPSQMALWQLS
uniref:Uncharacterized protein n=1 Tax=Rhizophora mucronata TaxID=61149 RepID=A0A2P2LKB8_RHIMU